MSDNGQSSNRLDQIEQILIRLAANQQADQLSRQELGQRLDRIAANL